MRKSQDVYGEPVVSRSGNIISTVRRPILTDEERARRMEEIKKAAINLIIAEERAKAKKKEDSNDT